MPGDPVTCPLCGALVRDKPDPIGARDVRALRKHFGTCPGSPPGPA